MVYRIDPAATLYWPPAVNSGDYRNVDLTIRGGSIHAGSVAAGMLDTSESTSANRRLRIYMAGVAPCNNTTARPEVSGITCPMTGTPPPPAPAAPAAPTNLRIIR